MTTSDDTKASLPSEEDEQGKAGSGAHSLAGYDYQADVSIWLALDVMLSSGLTQTIELEPASEEDIEAQLLDDEPGRVSTLAGMDEYTLVVQAKLRSGDAWTMKGVSRLLNHGSATRPSAAARLSNPKIRYLLITSAALNSSAKLLAVKHAGSWPRKSAMPAKLVAQLPKDAAGRVAIIGGMDEERLVLELKRLLIERFGVPYSRWTSCLEALREEARLRIRRAGEGCWHREELAQIIRRYDGFLASSPELENYVLPKNWQDLREAMLGPKHAAIIVGQSGTGKTFATAKLYDDLRREIPGLTRVSIRKGPQQVRDDQTAPPVIYDIEDPWGRYDLNSSSRQWNDELSILLSSARADRLFIATSRRDIASASGGLKSVEGWVIPLEAEHYGKAERRKLYRTRIKTLPRSTQMHAAAAEDQVLKQLGAPLEIEKFFDALRASDCTKSSRGHSFIHDAIEKAIENSIESTVVQQIEARDEFCAAAIIWGILKVNFQLSVQVLRDLDLDLAERVSALRNGTSPLVDFFVAARNLRNNDGYVTFYHPRVEAGIETALKRGNVPARRALRAFIEILIEQDGQHHNLGVEFATRLISECSEIPEISLKTIPKAAPRIDAWLAARLNDDGCLLKEYMRLAAAAGSPDSNVAELSRYLLNRPDSSFIGFDVWERPDHDEEWYARLGKDPAVADLARRFIADALPHDSIYYHVSLVDDLNRLATNLTSAYLNTAATMVRYGVASSSDAVLAGALRDLEGFEPIVDAAVEACTLTDAQQKEADENRITLINEVYNSDYAEHLAQNDDGYTAWEFLEGYANAVRRKHGWRFLENHRHANFLRPHWLRSLSIDAGVVTPSSDELRGVFACVTGSEHEEIFWSVIQSNWRDEFEQKLICRIREGSGFSSVRHSASACLLKHAPGSLAQAVNSLKNDGNHERIIELMIDLADVQKLDNGDSNIDAFAAIENLDSLCKEFYHAASSLLKDAPPSLSTASSNLLRSTRASSVSIRMMRIRMHRVFSDIVGEDIEWILSHSDDKALCIEAIGAAVYLGMSDIIQAALSHKFAHVVAKALTARAEKMSAPLPDELLSLMSNTGSPVRRALVTALISKPHQEHLPALLHLVKDQWSTFSRHYGEDDYFPIARLAAEAMANMDSIGHDVLQELQAIALESSDSAVRQELLCIIAVFGGTPLQRWLAELAIKPGRIQLRRAAARALVAKCLQLDIAVIRSLSTDVLLTVPYTVAPLLTLAAAVRLTPDERIQLARGLATNPQRRALILLLLWRELESTDKAIHAIESLLPRGHSSISWISKGLKEVAQDDLIADLGEPELCHAVLELLNPKRVKT